MTVTTEQRALWQRLADEATPGPWEFQESTVDNWPADAAQPDELIEFMPNADEGNHWPANGRFIAAAREAVPSLLLALERAEGEAERLQSDRDRWAARCAESDRLTLGIVRERAEARAERDALALRLRSADALDAAGFDLACTVSAFLVDARKRLGPEWTSALDVLTRDLDAYNDAADRARAALSPPAATTKETTP